MASTNNPMGTSTPPPDVSETTLPMSGLLCDVYGLEELVKRRASAVSCLWLHHPRLRAKEDMGDFASRVIARWEVMASSSSAAAGNGASGGDGGRALIAVAFDQQNHGTRTVAPTASDSWREGNATHALDMWTMVSGMASDTTALIDVVEGYLKLELARRGADEGWKMDQHLVLGVSLGGHSAWQTMFREDRVSAGVVIIGCPDYMALLSDRAKKSKLATFSAEDNGASFLGSRDFPPGLVASCLRHDPKGMLFGTGAVPASAEGVPENERRRLRGTLDRLRVGGKKFLVCSGAEDKLVPYKMSEPFIEFFAGAAGTWYADEGVTLENNVYEGVGHAFSERMVEDSLRFLVDAVAGKDGGRGGDERRARM